FGGDIAVELGQDIAHPFVGGGQGGGGFQLAEGTHGPDPGVEVGGAGRPAGQHRLDDIHLVAQILVPGAEAAEHKVQHLVGHPVVGEFVAVESAGLFDQHHQVQVVALFDNDAQGSQGGPA